jgi:hypothetical protein
MPSGSLQVHLNGSILPNSDSARLHSFIEVFVLIGDSQFVCVEAILSAIPARYPPQEVKSQIYDLSLLL